MGNYCIQDRVNSFYNLDENKAQLHAALLGSEAPSCCGSGQQRVGSSVSLSLGAPAPGSSAPRALVLLFTSSSCTVVAWLEGSFLKDAALSVTLTHYASGSSPLVSGRCWQRKGALTGWLVMWSVAVVIIYCGGKEGIGTFPEQCSVLHPGSRSPLTNSGEGREEGIGWLL